ncbi:hypothetical protein NDU88_008461 [Pleurodeles waltl]|uniref:Uncharacterized protein n=1 Tax=Pleurodeles waltl TaxID=8319 RepID=A0AAV7RVS3_PLEWA|nr:hypothetical protein NDU88_008461 [Pleurodeles waltl]
MCCGPHRGHSAGPGRSGHPPGGLLRLQCRACSQRAARSDPSAGVQRQWRVCPLRGCPVAQFKLMSSLLRWLAVRLPLPAQPPLPSAPCASGQRAEAARPAGVSPRRSMLRCPPSPRGSAVQSVAPATLERLTMSRIRGGHTRGPEAQSPPRRGAPISAAMLVLGPIGLQQVPGTYSSPPNLSAGSTGIREPVGTARATPPRWRTAISLGG